MGAHGQDEDMQRKRFGTEEREPKAAPPVVETSDPAISAGQGGQSQSDRPPAASTVVKTSGIRESNDPATPRILVVPVERTVPEQGRQDAGETQAKGNEKESSDRPKGAGQGGDKSAHAGGQAGEKGAHKGKNGDDDKNGDDHKSHWAAELTHAPSPTRTLIYSGLIAIVCGVFSAWAYGHFFLSKSDDKSSKDKHASKDSSDSGKSSKSADSGKSSKGSSSESGDEMTPLNPNDAETIRKQVEQISARIDNLNTRVDAVSRPHDWTPPDMRKLQVKVGELSHSVEEMGDPAAQVHRLEDRLEDLRRQFQGMKTQIADRAANESPTSPVPIPKR